jgi:hypothetical protein
MRGLGRYLTSYVLDFFRERMSREEVSALRVVRVLACGEGMVAFAQSAFPEAEVVESAQLRGLGARRRAHFDAACIAMTGGEAGERRRALLSGATHVLLVPSPDYIYRLGMRAGAAAWTWAIVDRFLLAPLALLWLVFTEAGFVLLHSRGAKQRRTCYDGAMGEPAGSQAEAACAEREGTTP